MAASGGCSSEACSSLKKRALLEQTIVEGIRANCVVLLDASRVPGEGEEEGLLMRRGCQLDSGKGAQ